jgi:hypothetical protein
MSGCRRNYQVNYARVPVDSTKNHNIDSIDSIGNYDDDPLFQDAQFEGKVEDMDSARREYKKFINGTGE